MSLPFREALLLAALLLPTASAAGELRVCADPNNLPYSNAREEGFEHIAYLFDAVGAIEKSHEERYLKLLENVNGKPQTRLRFGTC